MLITIGGTWSFWLWWYLPNFCSVLLVSNSIGITKISRFLKRSLLSVYCECHSSRTSYHDCTDWLQYRINLVAIVPVDFQQKNYITINDWIDPQKFLEFSACTQYSRYSLFCIYFCLCAGNIFNNGNQI